MHRMKAHHRRASRVQSVEFLETRRLFATFNVSNLNPTGAGSLNQAVLDANAAAGADNIAFDTGLTGTIDLDAAPLTITEDLDIQGPGATFVTVVAGGDDAGHNRVFEVNSPTADLTVRIAGLTITGGEDDDGGSGLFNDGENVTIDTCVFDSNATAAGNGGAILNTGDGSVTVFATTLVNNRADGDAGGGGAIYTDGGTVAISYSTFDSNLTTGVTAGGGGVFVAGGSISVTNSTFSGNSEGNGLGGAIYVAAGSSALVRASTFANNAATSDTAGAGGGMYIDGSAILENVLFGGNIAAGPTGSFDLQRGTGGHINASHSLIQTMSAGTINGSNTANILDQDPLLGDLADNGGPTQTIQPQPGSPVIDAGTAEGDLTTDQRGPGFPRTVDSAPDIGAFETGSAGPVISTPQITSVSPSPVPGSDQVQTLTITGTDFNDTATVTLRNETTGQDVTEFNVTGITTTEVTLDATFGNDAATWSVTVTNPDTGTTGAFEFDVQAAVPKTKVTIGTDQAKNVTYVDADGTSVTVTLKSGTADVVFDGENVQATPGKKGTTVSGTNLTIDAIGLDVTTSRSNLTIKTKGGDGRASLNAVTGATPLGKLAAATTDLSGDGIALTDQGTITTVQLNTIAHNASVTLPRANLKGVSFKVNDVQGAVINVSGAVKSFTAGTLSGTLTADAIQTLKVSGDLSAEVRAVDIIRSVTAGTFSNARILAGVRSDTSFLPGSTDDFTTPTASIGSVRVMSKAAGAFGPGSIVAAPTVGKVSVGTLNTANDGDTFGIGGDIIASVTGTAGTQKVKLSKLTQSSQTFTSGDFTVKVL